MKKVLLVWTCLLGTFLATFGQPSSENVAFSPKNGISNFIQKAKNGEAVTVAYLGGSITKAEGWRVKNLAWMSSHFKNDSIVGINAGVGGTGSELGVFRLEQDVLRHQPDLIFVEFAVNDGNPKDDLPIRKAMEGIVRKIWKALPESDICFVYTLKEAFLGDLQHRLFPTAAAAHEMVAEYYGIPSLHLGFSVVEKLTKQELIFTQKMGLDSLGYTENGKLVFSKDGVHPTLAGHEIYHQALKEAILDMENLSGNRPSSLKIPMLADNYEDARVVEITQVVQSGMSLLTAESHPDYFLGDQTYYDRFDTLILGSLPFNNLTFQMHGSMVGIWEVKGPKRGDMLVTIDGGTPLTYREHKIKGFDKYSSRWREGYRLLPPLEEKTYTVSIQVHPSIPEKKKILQTHPDPKHVEKFMEHPEYFQGTDLVIGRILIRGKLVSAP
ncbi:MAG: SGNH/GDSL hydrolase family protein [Bacteroidota bacterium]